MSKAKSEKAMWERLLEEHDRLVRRSNSTLYDRVVLLRKVYDDSAYKTAMREQRRPFTEELDTRVSDTCAPFTDLLQILKQYPDRKHWVNGDLANMRREVVNTVLTSEKERRNGETKTAKELGTPDGPGSGGETGVVDNSDRRLSWKQKYLELEQKYVELEAAHKQLEKDYRNLQRTLQPRQAG